MFLVLEMGVFGLGKGVGDGNDSRVAAKDRTVCAESKMCLLYVDPPGVRCKLERTFHAPG